MSILRKRMIEDMQLRGFSPRTQQSYSRAVRKLAQHYHKSPDLVTDEELRQYFLYRTNVSRWSRVACTIALCEIKFFYEKTLKRDWTTIGLVKPKRIKSLPTVLSLDEVRRTLACVHMLRHRVCLTTIYSCGLRLTEGRTLQIPDIAATACSSTSAVRATRTATSPCLSGLSNSSESSGRPIAIRIGSSLLPVAADGEKQPLTSPCPWRASR